MEEKCACFRGKTNETSDDMDKENLSMKLSRNVPLNAMRVLESAAVT